MNTHSIGAVLLAVGLCFASVSQAQHRPFHGERHSQRQVEQRADGRNGHGQQREFRRDRRGSDHRIDRRDHRRFERIHRIEQRQAQRHFRRDHRPFYGHRAPPRATWHRGHRGVWRGAGPAHRIYRGGRVPPQYRGRHYVVDNWRAHRLTRPPRGYHWVQTGPDYVLAAIATGLILHIMLGG